MKSPLGFAAAAVLLLALPVMLLYQLLGGPHVEVAIHLALALGAGLMSRAAFDFKTPRWIAWVGCAATGALAAIFLIQGLSELIQNPQLTDVVYRLLGQRIERWLVDLFLVWCVALLLTDSRGGTKQLGLPALIVAVGAEVYANWLAYLGTSLNAGAPALKLLIFLPVVWLLLESKKAPQLRASKTAVGAG